MTSRARPWCSVCCCRQEKELLKSSVEDTHLLTSVAGRCVVMPYRDYVACRYTELPERHVFICESRYIEPEKTIKKFFKPNSIVRVRHVTSRHLSLHRFGMS